MFHPEYEKVVEFASRGELAAEIVAARKDFVARTGDLFETDRSFERRIAAFLEWYTMDRSVSSRPNLTPVRMYIDHVAPGMTTPELAALRTLTRTRLSVFEFRGAKHERVKVVDLLTGEKLEVHERRTPVGLSTGDIIHARLVPRGEELVFSDAWLFPPREVRKQVLRATKTYRKTVPPPPEPARLDFVHRVDFLSNRCERFGHLDPKQIFGELRA